MPGAPETDLFLRVLVREELELLRACLSNALWFANVSDAAIETPTKVEVRRNGAGNFILTGSVFFNSEEKNIQQR
ncbi:hypothetical protein RUND412_000966 [Rhizina undulata]